MTHSQRVIPNKETTFEINYRQADLMEALQELSAKAGYHLVTTPGVQGNISISLKETSYANPLDFIDTQIK